MLAAKVHEVMKREHKRFRLAGATPKCLNKGSRITLTYEIPSPRKSRGRSYQRLRLQLFKLFAPFPIRMTLMRHLKREEYSEVKVRRGHENYINVHVPLEDEIAEIGRPASKTPKAARDALVALTARLWEEMGVYVSVPYSEGSTPL